jgi:Sulfotransferase family
VDYDLNYSPLDRVFHRLAFAAPFIQLTAADVEGVLYARQYRAARAERPIFVTSLPRAGTTVLLQALAELPAVATHTYRDMPFVMAPLWWDRMSGPFRRPSALRERAHGDGLRVGFDSPEAFEEVLWRTFWPEKYGRQRIALWSGTDGRSEARAFFHDHMKKIVALRRPGRLEDARYVSKNNANVGRLDLLPRLFPGAAVVVPVRQPIDQAASLLRQHRRFLAIHRDAPFVRRYMADIGHYEFGELHRPLAFPGTDAGLAQRDPLTIDYWLAYWIAAFEHVLARREAALIVPYERLCAAPVETLGSLCERLGLPEDGALPAAASRFGEAPPPNGESRRTADSTLRDHADDLYRQLQS